jgi:flavin prenyltransferase
MSEITTGVSFTLLTRAAEVVLKERRRLVLLLRSATAYQQLRAALALSKTGAIIAPPVSACYAEPRREERQCVATSR